MRTTILTSDSVRDLVLQVGLDMLMDELIEQLMAAFVRFDPRATHIPIRSGFNYEEPSPGLVEWMPIMQAGKQVVIKVVGYHPENPSQQNLPTILSTVSAYDPSNGHLIGLADGVFLTALRTGAASAVASQLMANPDSTVLGLVGCGAQAITQLHALSRVFDLERVLIYDIDPAIMASLPVRVAQLDLGLDIQQVALDALIEGSDIICTATSIGVGEGPVMDPERSRPWVHINAVGSDFPGKTELPLAFLKQSFVCPDFLEQAVLEGECQQLDPEDIGPSIIAFAQQSERHREVQMGRSVFDSTGWALEDQVALDLLLKHARTLGLGIDVELESISEEARNPYHFLNNPPSVRTFTLHRVDAKAVEAQTG